LHDVTDAGSNRTTGMAVAALGGGSKHTPQGGSSGLCALALAGGMTIACNRTETDKVGTVPERTSPSASPSTPSTPRSSDTTSSSSSSTTTTDMTTPSGSASGSVSGSATTSPSSSSSSNTSTK